MIIKEPIEEEEEESNRNGGKKQKQMQVEGFVKVERPSLDSNESKERVKMTEAQIMKIKPKVSLKIIKKEK